MGAETHEFWLRCKALFHKRRMDRDMAEELAFHQEMMREKLLREGATLEEANAMTRRDFGNEARWHERLRELWQFRSLEQLKRDTIFSLRLLRKSPVFTAVAVLTLALGIGANMSIFSMINALLLRPLPVPHSDELAVISFSQGRPEPNYSLASPFFRSLEKRHDVFSEVFAFSRYPFDVRMHGGMELMPGQMVGGHYFSGLEVQPLLGRTLTPKDDIPGAPVQSLVLSYDTWQRRFGGDPAVLGKTLEVSKVVFTIVGVMPKGFYGADPTDRPAFFIPLAIEPVINPENSITKAGYHGWWLSVIGRRQPNVTLAQANAALQAGTESILRDGVPDAGWIAQTMKDHSHFGAEAGGRGFTYMRLQFSKPLYAVFAMCGGILLLACLNLTSLLLARGASRERELATRLALGAARARLVQQMLVEALLLGAAGTAIGLAVAPLVSHSLAAVLLSGGGPAIATPHLDTSLDLRVFGFAALLVGALTLLIGLLPAVMATGGSVNEHLKEGQHAARNYTRRALLPRVLMASEVGLALTLLIGAGLLTASLTRLYRSGIGYDSKGLELLSFMMESEKLHGDALAQRYQQIGEGLARQPGVRSVSFVLISPFMGMSWDQGFMPQGEKTEKDVWMNVVAPGYFSTSGIAMLNGHDFSPSDTASSPLKIVINQTAAKLLFPNRNPIGQQMTRKDRNDKPLSYEVIAVVGDAKYSDIHKAAPATVYLTIAQNIDPFVSYNAVVRMSPNASASSLLAAARDVTHRVAPDVAAPTMTSLYQTVDNALATERVMVLLALYFAAVALLVTGIGLYGTLAYATARRTSEIGIRIALGAQRERVVALVFRENAILALSGVAAGLVLALIAARALTSFLFATKAHDPLVLALAVLALAAVASAASLVPALRASRIDPIRAIRCE